MSDIADRLHPSILRWCWEQGWADLREAQKAALPLIRDGDKDVIISAATAAGKTEAAFLPALSNLLENEDGNIVYVAPLKALINDQEDRLKKLTRHTDLKITPWHGDSPQEGKAAFKKHKSGVLLITPESLEAIMMGNGGGAFRKTIFFIIDEFHSFIGTERGIQLLSLMNRIEKAAKRRIPRVGLSATLGDMRLAAEQLRPGFGDDVHLIESKSEGKNLLVQLRGYLSNGDEETPDVSEITGHLFSVLRGSNNLVFPTRKAMVEIVTDALRSKCEEEGIPNEFYPHHGSLSKALREETEAALKKGNRPASAICTSTLEMGIDIGDVKCVVQIGPPPGVAALRQRLGRSGRRGDEPAILRALQIESSLTDDGLSSSDRMRAGTIRMMASIELLSKGWFEPPEPLGLHLSTAVQQLLSIICEKGGITPKDAWDMLVVSGPFKAIKPPVFGELLRALGAAKILEQSPDGTLMLGEMGEQVTRGYEFFAAFSGKEEVSVSCEGRHIGTIEPDETLAPGSLIILGGRRWEVVGYDSANTTANVVPAGGGKPPKYGGGAPLMHDVVGMEMKRILMDDNTPPYLHESGKKLLLEARHEFKRLHLDKQPFAEERDGTTLWHWHGTKIGETIALAFLKAGATGKVMLGRGSIFFAGMTPAELSVALSKIKEEGIPSEKELAETVLEKALGKWDGVLSDSLRCSNYASARLDREGATEVLNALFILNPEPTGQCPDDENS